MTSSWQTTEAPLCSGTWTFTDDLPEYSNTLYAAVYGSPVAAGKLTSLTFVGAQSLPGIAAVLTAKDIPGINDIGLGELRPLLTDSRVNYVGQPVAVVVAQTKNQARAGCAAIQADYSESVPVVDVREAYGAGRLIAPPRTISCGQDDPWAACEVVVRGRVESPPQEHFYLETQITYAIPVSDGIKLYCATQAPAQVQRAVARILKLPMSRVEVEVPRLGGGFGGKEEEATVWAALASLAAWKTGRPVRLKLSRTEDLRYTGKRYPVSSDFVLGLTKTGKILAYQATMYLNAGAYAGMSLAAMERALLHSTNMYHIPSVKVTGVCCRTHLPPFTACRGFGCPEAVLVIESAIAKAAEHMGIPAWEIQKQNMISRQDVFPYGQRADAAASECIKKLEQDYGLSRRYQRQQSYNRSHRSTKKGLAVMPLVFGVSFPTLYLNQAGAGIRIYNDGSVTVYTGAVEMGQGITRKLQNLLATYMGIPLKLIAVQSTNTVNIANSSPDAASVSYDLNGAALLKAGSQVMAVIRQTAAGMLPVSRSNVHRISIRNGIVWFDQQPTGITWKSVVAQAYHSRADLSAEAHYAPPGLWYDYQREQGEPFLYYVAGAALIHTTLDCVRGSYTVDEVVVVHDGGDGKTERIDKGQITGGFLQGLGWSTMEQVVYSTAGTLLTDSTMTYKVPTLEEAPQRFDISWVKGLPPQSVKHRLRRLLDKLRPNLEAVLPDGKAIGEPPFIYGVGTYFSLLSAVTAAGGTFDEFRLPLTPERVLLALPHGVDGG